MAERSPERSESPSARSELDEGGGWTPAFPGQRPPFEPGNKVGLKHGAYATLRLGPRVDELAEAIWELVPMRRPADELAVRTLALTLARIEAAYTALESALPGELARLEADMRGWVNTERRLLNDLGLTPASRGRLGVDVAVARRAESLTSLHEEAARERLGRDVVEGEEVAST